MKYSLKIIAAGLLLLAAMAAGCDRAAEEPGVVARVNGDPIYLSELEFKYDLLHMDGGGSIPSVEKIRKEYGSILSELIVQKLVAQELARNGLAVSEEELKEAEDRVRADYPEDSFDQVLIEEYIDLNAWREQLRARLAQQKFYQQILRPQIKISYEEAEAYYRDHLSEFYLPDRLKLLLVRGRDKKAVEAAAQSYLDDRDPVLLKKNWPQVETREIRILRDQLPPLWKNALKGLYPGRKSSVIQVKTGFECLVFQEELKARILPPSQAYTLVEKILLERKLREVFEQWLENGLAEAKITVSAQLQKPDDESSEAAGTDGSDAAPAGDDTAAEEKVETDADTHDGAQNGEVPSDASEETAS